MKRIVGVFWLLLLMAVPAFATVSVETTRVAYTCNGVLTSYAYPFKVLADADLLVVKKATATSAETTLTLNTDYTVTGAGTSGGNVVLTAGSKCGSGYTLTILRDMAATQTTDYVDGEAFSAVSIEDALDKVTLIQQQQREQIGRAPKLPETSTITDISLPNPTANNYIGWNAGATGLENKSSPVITTATQYEVDALVSYGGGTSYTQATIEAALTAIGTTNKVTLLLRPGTWAISTPLVIPVNVKLSMPNGSYFSFSGTGAITGLKYAEPRMFGDVTTAGLTLQKAIDSLSSGGILHISGQVKISTTAVVSGKIITIEGDDPISSDIYYAGTGGILKIENTVNVVLRNFGSSKCGSDDRGIIVDGVYRPSVTDIYLLGSLELLATEIFAPSTYGGVYWGNFRNIRTKTTLLHSTTVTAGINANTFTNLSTTNGIYFQNGGDGASFNTFVGCDFSYATIGVDIESQARGNVFINSFIENTTTSIRNAAFGTRFIGGIIPGGIFSSPIVTTQAFEEFTMDCNGYPRILLTDGTLREPNQAVNLTGATSGSTGIKVLNNAAITPGTGDFAIIQKFSLADWNPAADQQLFWMREGNQFGFAAQFVHNTHGLRFQTWSGGVGIDYATPDSIYINIVDDTNIELACVVVRETALTAGSITFYLNGLQVAPALVIVAGAPGTFSGTGDLYIMGDSFGDRTAGQVNHFYFINGYAPTAAEILSVNRNGIPTSWKWATTTLALEPEGIASDKWYDSSTNALHGAYPVAGASLLRSPHSLPSGTIDAAHGTTSTVVSNTSVTAGSLICVTATNAIAAGLTGVYADTLVAGTGFTLHFSDPGAANHGSFNYIISH